MPRGLEVLSIRKDYVGCGLGQIDGFSLGGNERISTLALSHSVHNHTNDHGDYGTTHTAADQLTSERC
jgi:hypothetical protein